MNRRIFSVILTLALLLGLGPLSVCAVDATSVEMEDAENAEWMDDTEEQSTVKGEWITVKGIEGGQICFDSSTGTITHCEDTVTVANIPATINGVRVTSIGRVAFSFCSSLTNISIPNSVTSIGDGAFKYCFNLTNISIPNSVTSIGKEAFLFCESLTSISIPDSVTSIGNEAFSLCESLTSISIPNSVTSIGDKAFENCIGLTSITLPNSVTSIGNEAFSFCENLTSISIPNSVTSIGNGAFSACSSLTSISIPSSVTSIEEGAFVGCCSLMNILVAEGNSEYSSLDGVLFNKSKSVILSYPAGREATSYTIPNSVTIIEAYTFYFCGSLTNITIPNRVTSIRKCAFSFCTSLTSISIPNSVTSIGKGAFSFCDSLTSITIPNCVTRIENEAFDQCTSLTSITIPNRVTSIGDGAFACCTSLTSITIPNSVTSIGDWAFEGCTSLNDVYYTGTESQWKAISIDNEYAGDDFLHATIHYNSPDPTATTEPSAAPVIQLSRQKLTVDGRDITCEKYNIDGSNYFKLRDLASLLNGTGSQFQVGYDAAANTVTITKGEAYTAVGGELEVGGDQSATAVISKQTIQIDGTAVSDLSVYNLGGNNYFKLRDLGDALGFGVDYDQATNTAVVTSTGNNSEK